MYSIEAAMRRANELSLFGLGLTYPNPIVGAVVIDAAGNLVGEGFHSRANHGAHAEVNALDAAGEKAKGATLVVTLEPCNHHGKTPPCVERIIKSGIKRVIYAVSDPNKVASGGAKSLQNSGIEVTQDILSNEVEFSNRAWLKKIRTGNVYITLKLATSIDGKIAAQDGSSKWITSESARADVALLRSECDAIITGTGTVIADNPALTVRNVDRNGITEFNPARVVVGNRQVPLEAEIRKGSAVTYFLQNHDLSQLLQLASENDWNRILVEAGPGLTTAVLRDGLADEIFLYQASTFLGGSKSVVTDLGVTNIQDRIEFEIREVVTLGTDNPNLRIHLMKRSA
jgi:diaminohydroxyphosphoribosylaminopyrimidine deaminase/5-amino-6-(5-phosphoribosylamino)uracil reductase